MVVPALLAGGNMGNGGANLILICEGIEEGVAKRMGGLGEAALTSGDAEGSMVLKMTRMGSLSGAWTMKMRRWALLMPPGPSCRSRYLLRDQVGLVGADPQLLSLCPLCPFSHRRAPRNLFLRSKSLISRAWRKRRRSLQKGWMTRGLRQVSPYNLAGRLSCPLTCDVCVPMYAFTSRARTQIRGEGPLSGVSRMTFGAL